MKHNTVAALFAALTLTGAPALAQTPPAADATRGALLYETHCIACHTTQVHWRKNKAATDWQSLKAEVRRWQGNAGLDWREADIEEVARHLNDSIYRFTRPTAARRAPAGPA